MTKLLAVWGVLAAIFCVTAARGADQRSAVWEKNKLAIVRIKVTGRNPQGEAVPARYGVGVVVRSRGEIITAAQMIGQDSEWNQIPSGLDRQIEISGLDTFRIIKPLGNASARLIPSLNVAILTITAEGLSTARVAEYAPDELATFVTIAWEPQNSIPEAVSTDGVPTDRGRDGDVLTVRFPAIDGYFGAGVFDAESNLVGIVYKRRDASRLLAVPSYLFNQFLSPDGSAGRRAGDTVLTAFLNVKFSTPTSDSPDAMLKSFNLNVTNEENQPVFLDPSLRCLGTDLSKESTLEPLMVRFKSNEVTRISSKDTASIVFEYSDTSPVVLKGAAEARRFWTVDGSKTVPQFSCIYAYTVGGKLRLGATAPALFVRHVVP
ncbi:trypsin-like peptidase domain-containing protein [Bradyrhizobium sp. CCBAU 53421]|uniref:trypsin-like peptidase domain-containing protein n=1 Tax=Bradyrhizobium sp. CCBAU 53421 TaxID=1325120 RepID=UPI00188CA8C9|nr:trypsin-like peptidase domain-containing protein [Bradyrhizobium sp. CCBAU 53421]QOZ36481.1 hypothetical protein XH92_36845 [Bradyrhizobium sp. CCBAU 53421]